MIDITNNITFIIPAYNAAATLERCVLSITSDLSESNILIIDDGSKDTTKKICQKMQKANDHIQVIYNKNHGVSYSRNCGIKHCKTDYLFFVDADDQVFAKNIKPMLQHFDPSIDVLKFSYEMVQKKKTKQILFEENIFEISKKDMQNHINSNFFSSSSYNTVWGAIISKKILQKHQLQFREDLSFAEDIYFNIQLYNACNKIRFTDILGYSYDDNGGVTRTFNHDVLMKRISNVLKVFSEFLKFKYLDSSVVAQKCMFEIFPQIMRLTEHCSKKQWLTMVSKIVTMSEYQEIRQKVSISSYQGNYKKIIAFFLKEKYSIVYFYAKYVYLSFKKLQNLKNRIGV